MIDKIRDDIERNVGRNVCIIYNEGRNKIYKYCGKLIEVYNSVFIVLDDKINSKRSFSYYDVLTGVVKIYFDGEKK